MVAEKVLWSRKYGDCVVTAIGRALDVTYEDAARVCGIELDADGLPAVTKDGIAINQVIPHLWRYGIAAVHLVSDCHPRAKDIPGRLPTPGEIESLLRGERAIVAAICHCMSAAELDHYFAWDGSQVVEDRMRPAWPIPLMREYCNVIGPIVEALILRPVSCSSRSVGWTKRPLERPMKLSGQLSPNLKTASTS